MIIMRRLNIIAYWIQNEIKTGNFRKHPAADVWFERNVTNDTLSVERKFVFSANIRGPISLGLYAPAGEIIELEFDDDTWELMKASNWKGMSISINQNFWDSYPADNTDFASLTKIDTRNTQEIPLTGKRIKIVTTHPDTSYSLEGDPKRPTSIRITNPDLFWKASKCLVIMVD